MGNCFCLQKETNIESFPLPYQKMEETKEQQKQEPKPIQNDNDDFIQNIYRIKFTRMNRLIVIEMDQFLIKEIEAPEILNNNQILYQIPFSQLKPPLHSKKVNTQIHFEKCMHAFELLNYCFQKFEYVAIWSSKLRHCTHFLTDHFFAHFPFIFQFGKEDMNYLHLKMNPSRFQKNYKKISVKNHALVIQTFPFLKNIMYTYVDTCAEHNILFPQNSIIVENPHDFFELNHASVLFFYARNRYANPYDKKNIQFKEPLIKIN